MCVLDDVKIVGNVMKCLFRFELQQFNERQTFWHREDSSGNHANVALRDRLGIDC